MSEKAKLRTKRLAKPRSAAAKIAQQTAAAYVAAEAALTAIEEREAREAVRRASAR